MEFRISVVESWPPPTPIVTLPIPCPFNQGSLVLGALALQAISIKTEAAKPKATSQQALDSEIPWVRQENLVQ